MLIPRRGREGKQPQEDRPDDSSVARRVLEHATSPEEKLEQMLGARSHELEEQARRFEEAMADLERREQLLRDMRASVERLLRLGTRDLTDRERELQELGQEFLEREARLSAEEAELGRRRSELGAVELKREAVEQRERTLAARERELSSEPEAPVVAPGDNVSEDRGAGPAQVTLLFVPGPAYQLVEVEHRSLQPGEPVEFSGDQFVVARVGPSPLPGDVRVCAYLESSPSPSSGSGGSS